MPNAADAVGHFVGDKAALRLLGKWVSHSNRMGEKGGRLRAYSYDQELVDRDVALLQQDEKKMVNGQESQRKVIS